jgi:hypothetical protein
MDRAGFAKAAEVVDAAAKITMIGNIEKAEPGSGVLRWVAQL